MSGKKNGKNLIQGFILLCVGGVLLAIGLILGGVLTKDGELIFGNGDGFHYSWNYSYPSDDEKIQPVEILAGPIPQSVRTITVDVHAASVKITTGMIPSYRATDFKKDSITIVMDGDKLAIEEKGWKHTLRLGKKNLKGDLEIILPEDVTLDASNIVIGAGSLTLADFDSTQFTVESGVGSITATNLHARKITVKTGAGALDFIDCSFDDATIEAGTGRITFEGEFASQATISTGVGSIELRLPDSEDSYHVDFTRGLGSVRIGHSSYEGIGSGTAGNMNADRRLALSTGLGSIGILFNE